MPKVPEVFAKQISKVYDYYSGDVGNALIHLGAVGWLFSAAAQITMIARNKDIDKKEKKFLIPQETADGVINVGLYYTVCAGIKKVADVVLENAIFVTKKTHNALDMFSDIPVSMTEFTKGMKEKINLVKALSVNCKGKGRVTTFYEGTLKYIELLTTTDIKEKCGQTLKNVYKFFDKPDKLLDTPAKFLEKSEMLSTQKIMIKKAFEGFKNFKNGIGVIAAVGASVLACNIITPVARNMAASYYQKKSIERSKKNNPVTKTQTPYIIPSSKTFNGFKI